jgi:D-alanyl-D-alanine carboxypeptidase
MTRARFRFPALILATCLVVATPAAPAAGDTRDARAVGVRSELQSVLDGYVSAHADLIPGAVLHVQAPRLGLDWEGASGLFQFGDDRPLAPTDPFRTASVTKTFTAATALRLVESGKLSLDDRISKYLSRDLVRRVHVLNGRSYGNRITIRQLLDHTSGVYDYAMDEAWITEVIGDPQRTWTPLELLDVAITHGTPYFVPGEGFHYSDTGYVLAGLVIEKASGLRLHEAYRRYLSFDELGLDGTYLEFHEAPPPGARPRAHQYFPVGPIDATDWNPTFDTFGGGGLVSTAHDLDAFVRALFEGRVFDRRRTLRTMLTVSRYSDYALGIEKVQLEGETAWTHNGFFGAFMYYVPSLDLSFGGSEDILPITNAELAGAVVSTVRRRQG